MTVETLSPVALAEHFAAGATTQIGAVDATGRPTLCRGLASLVEPDGRVLVILSREAGFEVLAAIAETRRISAVFALPSTFRTIHLKGVDAAIESARHLRAVVDARREALDRQLAPHGYPPGLTASWYAVSDEDLVAIRFTPIGAWNQTPGPGAGDRMELGRDP